MEISHYRMGIEGTVNDVIWGGQWVKCQLKSKGTIINAKNQIFFPFITIYLDYLKNSLIDLDSENGAEEETEENSKDDESKTGGDSDE